jgi:succinate dehydrogenase / fumarate reductase, cytochrome b subunit
MPARPRPLSPHVDIYRWQIGSTLSILHRLTGVALSVGLLALCYWLVSLAADQSAYRRAVGFFTSVPGLLLLAGMAYAFFYHLLNGVRHLFWDIGRGYERAQRNGSGWLVVAGSVALSGAVWLVLWHASRGGA